MNATYNRIWDLVEPLPDQRICIRTEDDGTGQLFLLYSDEAERADLEELASKLQDLAGPGVTVEPFCRPEPR